MVNHDLGMGHQHQHRMVNDTDHWAVPRDEVVALPNIMPAQNALQPELHDRTEAFAEAA